MRLGYEKLTNEDKQAFLKLGHTILTEKLENNMHEDHDFLLHEGIKISVYRHDGALVFQANVNQSKYGYRVRDTWNSYEDEPRERQLRPQNIIKGLTLNKLNAWLDHCIYFYNEKIKKYEAMLKLYKERQAECKAMGGEWVFASYGYWEKKAGKKPEKSKDDYFTVTAGVFQFKKTVYGHESIEYMSWKVDDYKALFVQLKSIAKPKKAEVTE